MKYVIYFLLAFLSINEAVAQNKWVFNDYVSKEADFNPIYDNIGIFYGSYKLHIDNINIGYPLYGFALREHGEWNQHLSSYSLSKSNVDGLVDYDTWYTLSKDCYDSVGYAELELMRVAQTVNRPTWIELAVSSNAVRLRFISDIPTSVDKVETNDSKPRYFNLQGIEIAEPESGIYIEIRNGKSHKIMK